MVAVILSVMRGVQLKMAHRLLLPAVNLEMLGYLPMHIVVVPILLKLIFHF